MHALFSFHLLSQLVGGASATWVDVRFGCRSYLREGKAPKPKSLKSYLSQKKWDSGPSLLVSESPKTVFISLALKAVLRIIQKATSHSVWVVFEAWVTLFCHKEFALHPLSPYPVADKIPDIGSAGYIMWANCEAVCCLPFSGSLNQHSAIFQSGHNTLLTWLSVFHSFLNSDVRELRYSLFILIIKIQSY